MALRVVFFGTPEFAVRSLEALVRSSHPVAGVVTQPDRPRGRGQRVTPSAVKAAAVGYGLPVLQPTRLKDPATLDQIRSLAPDIGVVAAYGRILPAELLAVPRLGMINVHASLLPRWRGAAPVHRAIMAGDHDTGVSIMRVVVALDAGPVLARVPTPIDPDETSEILETRLATIGADLLVETLNAIARGPVREEPQDESQVTYAARLERRDGDLQWDRPAVEVHNRIRGVRPWPLASVVFQGRRLLLHRSVAAPGETHASEPGTVLRVEPDALVVATNPGAVRLTSVQLEGRPPMEVAAFLNGHRVVPGERLLARPPAGA